MRVPTGATLTTFSIFRYPRGSRMWALQQMGRARRRLATTPGLGFHRLLGSGAGLGFSRVPDFSRYALLATWSSEQAADDFFAASPFLADTRRHASEVWTVKLLARRSRGSWKRQTPFTASPHELSPDLPAVVITRASLRLRAMLRFWSRIPAIERDLVVAPGLRLALGVGELPWIRPVTFSVWDDEAAVDRFAYAGSCHHAAARAAHARGWFREDLFARFTAIATQGRLAGRDPCGLVSGPKDMSFGPVLLTAS
jgi:heme-degrading monooxygenase HmoA